MPSLPPVTQAILLINIALFCLDIAVGQSLSHGWLALWPLSSPDFMPWQVVTYAFMHGSMIHIFLNMMALWMFGGELESVWGARRFIQFYGASILAAAAAQLLVSSVMGWGSPTVGASGGTFGLLLAYGMMFPDRTIMPLFPPIPMKAKYFVMIYGAVELYQGVSNTMSGVAHFAHLGGMLGGWLVIRYWRGQLPFSKAPRGPRGRF
jgi:membrane associated rhomboid family serine protease